MHDQSEAYDSFGRREREAPLPEFIEHASLSERS
jgi:hypothetical protein